MLPFWERLRSQKLKPSGENFLCEEFEWNKRDQGLSANL
jgi:hypothetical protein